MAEELVQLDEETAKLMVTKFFEQTQGYRPDWKKIAETNQYVGKLTDQEAYAKKLAAFKKAIAVIKEEHELSHQQMADRLSCSKQQISKILTSNINPKNGTVSIKKIPTDKIDLITEVFSVSGAYLLGLTEDVEKEFSYEAYYFWENPDSEFLPIRDRVVKEYQYGVATFGSPLALLKEKLWENLKDDYELILALNSMLKSEDRKKYVDIIKAIYRLK